MGTRGFCCLQGGGWRPGVLPIARRAPDRLFDVRPTRFGDLRETNDEGGLASRLSFLLFLEVGTMRQICMDYGLILLQIADFGEKAEVEGSAVGGMRS